MAPAIDWNPLANELFLRASEIECPDERREFLAKECADNPALHRLVESLLAASQRVSKFLAHAAVALPGDNAPTAEFHPIAEGPGTVIGPYKLLQVIGEGGMGVVYMAEQTVPVERRVALKIIKPGMDTKQVIARFEAERQALALMSHPNIAKVLDAGTTESRRPFFVMELVKGVPITQYCDENHLTLRERLALFLPVCQAIQHAHQKGIIHRDIKPSNVLVAQYDGRPVPLVIDFGVAKATAQRLTDKTMFTQLGQLVGTLEYMSPEQAQLNQLDIDTRSDVYSLGVVLYELLTGETPLDQKRLRAAAFDEMLRIIREEEPPKPSTRVSSAATLPSIAANRGVDPSRLGSAIRGDLDWIVMKALEKDRGRRYDSASGFAADILHYLADEPVQACPPSTIYRFRKFVRRNRLALATSALVATVLIVGSGVSLWQAIQKDKALALAAERENLVEQHWKPLYDRGGRRFEIFTQRSRKFDDASSETLSRIAALLKEDGQWDSPDWQMLRRDLFDSVVTYWDKLIQIDTSLDGEPYGHSEFYRVQRALCRAYAGDHKLAASEAAELCREENKLPPSLLNELSGVYALCAAAAKDDEELAAQYSHRADELLHQAANEGYFKIPEGERRWGPTPRL